MKSVSIIIPAYNEEKRIEETLAAVKKLAGVDLILVINDGSTDATAAIARQAGVKVVDLSSNRGKGEAINASLAWVDTDIVVFLDADLGSSAAEAYKIIEPVVNGEADLCIAAFPPPLKKGGFGMVKGTAAWIIKKLGGDAAISPLSGQRALTREVIENIAPFHAGFGLELGMTVDALLKGYKIVEVPTAMHHNETGRDWEGFLHRGRQLLDIFKLLYHLRRKGICIWPW